MNKQVGNQNQPQVKTVSRRFSLSPKAKRVLIICMAIVLLGAGGYMLYGLLTKDDNGPGPLDYQAQLSQAQTAFEAENYDEAKRLALSAADSTDETAKKVVAYDVASESNALLGDYEASVEMFRQAKEAASKEDAGYPFVVQRLAVAYEGVLDYDKAIVEQKELISLYENKAYKEMPYSKKVAEQTLSSLEAQKDVNDEYPPLVTPIDREAQ